MQEKYNEAMPVLEDTVALLETVMHLPVSANDPSACTELSCNCPLLPDFRIRVDIGVFITGMIVCTIALHISGMVKPYIGAVLLIR